MAIEISQRYLIPFAFSPWTPKSVFHSVLSVAIVRAPYQVLPTPPNSLFTYLLDVYLGLLIFLFHCGFHCKASFWDQTQRYLRNLKCSIKYPANYLRFLWNPRVQCRIRKGPGIISILSILNSLYWRLLKIHYNIAFSEGLVYSRISKNSESILNNILRSGFIPWSFNVLNLINLTLRWTVQTMKFIAKHSPLPILTLLGSEYLP